MNKRQRKKLFDQSRTIWRMKYRPLWRKLWLEFRGGRRALDLKLRWVATLRVGDVVNDCRYRNLRIEKLYEAPYDADLVLEDGSHCSAMSCCNPPMSEEDIANHRGTP